MGHRIPREEDNVGRVAVTGTDYGSVRIPLGKGNGVLRIQVTPTGRIFRRAAQIYIQWEGRPGERQVPWPISASYVTHALLDLKTGDIYPGYQVGDPEIDDILGNRDDADVEGEAFDEDAHEDVLQLPAAAESERT